MKNKIHFFRSVSFKIALSFILLLLVSIEIVGAYFIQKLEQNTIDNFVAQSKPQVESWAVSIGSELERTDSNRTNIDSEIKRILMERATPETLEARVIDERGIVRATSDLNRQSDVGKKNNYQEMNEYTLMQRETLDGDRRVLINVQPIYSATSGTVIGALYVKSDLESKYQEVSDVVLIFLTAALIASAIAMIVAVLVARSITQPIDEMREQALRIARGDYSGKVAVHGKDELSQLALTFNALSDRIEETQDTLEAERNRLDSVLTHMSDGVIATNRRGKVTIINEMALNLLDTTYEEAIGSSILKLLDIEEDYTFRKLLENPEELLLHNDNKDEAGTQTVVRVNFSMIRRESGFISGLVAVLHDITEQAKDDRERREFVSNVSHELRTPLTSMYSYLEALSEGAWKNPKVAPEFLSVTLDETDRMIRMINDLLNLSRMDSGRSQLQLEYANFNELVNFVLNRFDMILKKKNENHTIKREFTKRDLWVEVDTDKMIQVLDNILNNALKYSPDGGVITCRLIETHNNVLLSISDQGLGIPKKDLGKVFDRFYRVDKARSRAQGGTGLGLAISKEVIEAHGGKIWVKSREGKGSTFYISLPYQPFEEDWWA
ncbi:cell wall metabolism sensor histidine kinase WalK [Enterococcus hirae]|nr:cell wall metabolism sensor histidine kinase WalK [Enterococcus hirae]